MLNDFPLAISIIKSHAFKISDCSFYNQSNPSIPSFTKPKDENTLPRTKEIKVGVEIKKKERRGSLENLPKHGGQFSKKPEMDQRLF